MRTCEIPLYALNKCREPLIQSILAVDTFRFLPVRMDGTEFSHKSSCHHHLPSPIYTAIPMFSQARQVGWRQRRYICPMLLRSQIILLLIRLLCGDSRQDRSFLEQADPIAISTHHSHDYWGSLSMNVTKRAAFPGCSESAEIASLSRQSNSSHLTFSGTKLFQQELS